MAIDRIEQEKCIGCGICVLSCPADVIRMNESSKKAEPRYKEDCVTCCWCLAECPKQAVIHTAAVVAPVFTSWG